MGEKRRQDETTKAEWQEALPGCALVGLLCLFSLSICFAPLKSHGAGQRPRAGGTRPSDPGLKNHSLATMARMMRRMMSCGPHQWARRLRSAGAGPSTCQTGAGSDRPVQQPNIHHLLPRSSRTHIQRSGKPFQSQS